MQRNGPKRQRRNYAAGEQHRRCSVAWRNRETGQQRKCSNSKQIPATGDRKAESSKIGSKTPVWKNQVASKDRDRGAPNGVNRDGRYSINTINSEKAPTP